MEYKKNDERRYFPAMIAALIVIAIALAGFVYSLVKAEPEDLESILIDEIDGVPSLSPGPGMAFPTGPPNIPQPTGPPPG